MTTATKTEAGAVEAAPASGPAPVDEASQAPRLLKETKRLARRFRWQLMPIAAMAATHGVGAGIGAEETQTLADLSLLALGCGGAGGAYLYAHKHTSGYGRVYAGVAALGSALFQAGIGATGWDSGWAAALWTLGSLAALPIVVGHSEPDPDVTAELEAAADLPPALLEAKPADEPQVKDHRQELWDQHLAAKGKKVPESELLDLSEFEHGWKAVVRVPKPRNWSEVFHARAEIESTYDLEMHRAFVESIPGRDVKYCRLTVLERDPLQQVTHFEGLGLDVTKGSFPVMVTADGEVLDFQLWVPGEGGSHALVSGGTRTGKSTLLKLLMTECSGSDRIHPLIIDGAGGASLAHWKGNGEYATTLKDAKEMMRYAIDLLDKRNPDLVEQIRAGGPESIDPNPDQPLIPVLIDEAHEFLMADQKFVRLCERFAQKQAKYAGSLILSTQVPSVEQLGGSSALRAQLKMGTVIALRLTEGSSQHMLEVGDPMPEDLRNLPAEFPDGSKTRGLGYMMTKRKIRSRVIYLKDPTQWPKVDAPLEATLAAVPKPKLTGEQDEQPKRAEGGTAASDVDIIAHALADGCPQTVGDLMHATGLSMPRVTAALREFKD